MGRRVESEDSVMKCMYCQGEMQRGSAPLHVDREGCHVMLDSVAAWVCTQCGEAYFEEREVESIQELVRSVDENAKKLGASA